MEASQHKKPILFIFFTLVLDMLGIGIIVPVLPDVIRRFVQDPNEVSRYFGYFIATYAVMQFFASPILGNLSDRFGRRPILLGSLLGASLDYVFMAFAPSLGFLFFGRFISGLTGASMTVANSFIADISTDKNRSAHFGMVGAAFGIGFILGPLLGGALGHFSSIAPFLAAAVLNFLNFLFGVFLLPESLKKENRRALQFNKMNPFSTLKRLFSHKSILIFIIVYALLFLAGQVHPNIWTLYTEYKFSWNSFQVGLSLSFVGLVFGLSQMFVTKKLVPLWGEQKALFIGVCVSIVAYALYGFANQGWMMYAIMFGSVLSGLATPCLQSIMTATVEANRQGELQGGLVSLSSLASIISPLVYTHSFRFGTNPESLFQFSGLPYLIASAVTLIGLVLLLSKKTKLN